MVAYPSEVNLTPFVVTFSNFDPKVAHDELLELKCWRSLGP